MTKKGRKLILMTSKGWKKGELCRQYVYCDEHRCPVLGKLTDRHNPLSEREKKGILPHLAAASAAASPTISSLIVSDNATHRQTAFLLHLSLENRSPRLTRLPITLKKCSFKLWFCLGRIIRKKGQRNIESSSSRQKQRGNTLHHFLPGYGL